MKRIGNKVSSVHLCTGLVPNLGKAVNISCPEGLEGEKVLRML